MRSTHQVAAEILDVTNRDIPEDQKIELIAKIIQDYTEDCISEQRIIY